MHRTKHPAHSETRRKIKVNRIEKDNTLAYHCAGGVAIVVGSRLWDDLILEKGCQLLQLRIGKACANLVYSVLG